ncbi:MAG: sulfate ABC transporter substrate-binding protein [Moraxellaceae bacterium]|nr:sulfate ABC transporter substrate-binding protein [Moraxellaceae bacterium]
MSAPRFARSLGLFAGLALLAAPVLAETSLLNVSYDVTRELYKEVNPAFVAHWKAKKGVDVTVNQSHGGSTKQSQSVAAGLEADVVTMNQAPDIESLVKAERVSKNWRAEFPHDATPYTTTSVLIVRKGNPKKIKDWNDLARKGVTVIVPNPKTSGNGRYTYLAAWGYSLKKGGGEAKARAFVKDLFANVPVLDGGGRGATTTFAQREIGDVLVTFENEAGLLAKEFGEDKFEVVYPSVSIEAAAPVALVNPIVDKRGTRELAKGYLDFLYTPEGQEIIAKQGFRPRDKTVLARHAKRFPKLETFTVETLLGGWTKVHEQHFADGAYYDQIIVR